METDSTTIRQWLESMDGGVLVYAHCGVTASLHQLEGTVGRVTSCPWRSGVSTGWAAACSEGDQQEWERAGHAGPSVLELDLVQLLLGCHLAKAPEDRFQELDSEE